MDIYLIQECRFFIGAGSGPFMVACLFQKPCIVPNMYEWLIECPVRRGDLGILKHIYSKSKKKFLSLRERLDELKDIQNFVFLKDDYEMYENTPQEIYDLVKEYLDNTANQEQCTLSPLQKEWSRRRSLDGRNFFQNIQLAKDPHRDVGNRFRLALLFDGFTGTIGQRYIEQNWEKSIMNKNCHTKEPKYTD